MRTPAEIDASRASRIARQQARSEDHLAVRTGASPRNNPETLRCTAEEEDDPSDDCRNDHEHDRKEWRDGR